MRSLDLLNALDPIEETAQLPPMQHLSASQLNMLLTCPEQWRRRYLLGEKEAPGGSRLLGTATHKAIEVNFLHRIETGEQLPEADVLDTFHETWEREIEEVGGAGEVRWDAKEAPDVLRSQGHALTAAYHSVVAPRVHPIAAEQRFRIEGLPVPIVGVIDVETRNHLIDVKTTSKKASTPKSSWLNQARLYQLRTPKAFEWHLLTRTKTPAVYTPHDVPGLTLPYVEVARNVTLRQIDFALRLLADQWRRYGPDRPWDYLGLTQDAWVCQWCGWGPQNKNVCQAWR